MSLDHSPNWAIPSALIIVQPGENESALGNNCPNHFLTEMFVLHQPPKYTILRNYSQL
jgi:hypothetical protein